MDNRVYREKANQLVEKIELDLMEVMDFRPSFYMFQQKEEIYSISYYHRSLTFNFDIVFPKKEYYPYLYIIKLEVQPKGKGRGSLIVEKFLNRVIEAELFEGVYITSMKERTDKFWSKLGFQYRESKEQHIDKYHICNPNMVYHTKSNIKHGEVPTTIEV